MPSAGRTIAIVLAIVLAGVATFAIITYVRGIEDRAFQEAELVEVFVASELIPEGTSFEAATGQGLIEQDQLPRASLPDGVVADLSSLSGLVTTAPILPQEVIVQARWADPAVASTSEFEIPENKEAISVQVGLVPGVAGFIQRGDIVSLIAHINAPAFPPGGGQGDPAAPAPEEQAEATVSRYLLQNLQVLAVGQLVNTTTAEGESGEQVQESAENVILTLAVTPEQAEQLVFAVNEASLYFTLLPENASEVDDIDALEEADTPGRGFDNIFNQ